MLETACDCAIVKLAMIRCQSYLDEGLTRDQAAERMRSEFMPEARAWREKQNLKFRPDARGATAD
jgi:hypothetical protein